MEKQNPSSKVLRQQEAEFCILQAIAGNPQISQWEMAEDLGLSLGRAHYCLSALIKIGWVQVRNFASSGNKRQYAYTLTLLGLAHKAAIAGKFSRRKIEEYETLRLEIE